MYIELHILGLYLIEDKSMIYSHPRESADTHRMDSQTDEIEPNTLW